MVHTLVLHKRVTVNTTGSIPARGGEIFSFIGSGFDSKRGVEFCHLTRNGSRIQTGNGVSLFLSILNHLFCNYSLKKSIHCSFFIFFRH